MDGLEVLTDRRLIERSQAALGRNRSGGTSQAVSVGKLEKRDLASEEVVSPLLRPEAAGDGFRCHRLWGYPMV